MPRRVFFSRRLGVAHLIDDLALLNTFPGTSALCGITPHWPIEWFGEGTQREYDEAASRRTCSRCQHVLDRQNPIEQGAS